MTTQSKTTHTPGPWRHEDINAQDVITGSGGIWVASCEDYGMDAKELSANARLIAAAPDLLEACRALVETCDHYDGDPALKQARAAIEKATG